MITTALIVALATLAQPAGQPPVKGPGATGQPAPAPGSHQAAPPAHADGPEALKGPPLDFRKLEAPLLTHHIQLTTREQFRKAGESYFSPDNEWVIFQATPASATAADPYGMYVGHLEKDKDGHITGFTQITRVSAPDTANTCSWFHPSDPSRVLFGSTVTKPKEEPKSGFQVGTNKYVWQFPGEMDVVECTPFIVEGKKRVGIDKNMAPPKPVFTLPNYDAECSWSNDGRFILYSHIEDAKEGQRPDANIYIYDTKTKKHIPIVIAPGYDGGPFYSPDNKSICYRSDRKGNDVLQLFVADLKFAKDADGTMVPVGIEKEYQLTDSETVVSWCPYWHPSGKYMIYATSEVAHSNYEVFAIETDMAKLRAGASPSSMRRARVTFGDGADVLPVFSADGKYMIWTAQRGPRAEGDAKPSSQLWIAEWTGDPFAQPKKETGGR